MDKEKYKKRTIKSLHALAVKTCHLYIRTRDKDLRCISCQQPFPVAAGHYYESRKFAPLRFNEFNINKQCTGCNYRGAANLIYYTRNILPKIGRYQLNKLHKQADQHLENVKNGVKFKWTKDELIDIIIFYQKKIKQLE